MERWEEMAEQMSQVTDKLGKPIDTKIFDVVVGLNVLGIETRQSCEGHLDWGEPYPWVDIIADLTHKYRVHQLLGQFYQQCPAGNWDLALTWQGYRLRPGCGAFASLWPEEERAARLRACQEETERLAQFLRSKVGGNLV